MMAAIALDASAGLLMIRPFVSCWITLGASPTGVQMTGNPQAIASSSALESPSDSEAFHSSTLSQAKRFERPIFMLGRPCERIRQIVVLDTLNLRINWRSVINSSSGISSKS